MIIQKLKFENYRCFIDEELEFGVDKPLNLVLGYNGAGKTEILYAIWFVLHGFDFKTLKSKENAPYALNTGIYNKLNTDPNYFTATSSVTMEFSHQRENDMIRNYVLKRYQVFKKNSEVPEETVEMYYYMPNGEKSSLVDNRAEVEKMVEEIIPQKVLSGIIFDGERMKSLSSEDENSLKAIEGTIQDVTNQKLIQKLEQEFSSLERKYNRERQKMARESGDEELTSLYESYNLAIQNLEDDKKNLISIEKNIKPIEQKVRDLSQKLIGYDETKALEVRRTSAHTEKLKSEKKLENILSSLRDKELKETSLMISNKLVEDINLLIDENKAPKGLTSDAVENIINQNKCICGREHTELTIKTISDLKMELPPENMNATIYEWVDTIKDQSLVKKNSIITIWNEINNIKEEIQEYKDEISLVASKITNINNRDLQEMEREKQKLESNLTSMFGTISQLKRDIQNREHRLKDLEKKIAKKKTTDKEINRINIKSEFLNKSKTLLNVIKDRNSENGLSEINRLMNFAFKEISEEYDQGRRVYITQFVKEKYKLVSYYEAEFDAYKSSPDLAMLRKKYRSLSLDNPTHLNEAIILEVAQNKSTGQSKIVTMSFVKAILDYSSLEKKGELETKKEYPLVLDAPFSELSGDNLYKSAQNLYKFNKQTIVLIDYDTNEQLQEYFKDHISTIHELHKGKGQSSNFIRRIK